MKIWKSALAYVGLAGCLCVVGFVTRVGGQAPLGDQAPAGAQGILGTLDPQTGAFKPLTKPNRVKDEGGIYGTTTPTTGTLQVNVTITIKSTIPSTEPIACTVTAVMEEVYDSVYVNESATALAVRSGSTATCSMTIPYSWYLEAPASDVITITSTITTPLNWLNAGVAAARVSTQTWGYIYVPTSGATTPIAVAATI
jgi:hypothetical protein